MVLKQNNYKATVFNGVLFKHIITHLNKLTNSKSFQKPGGPRYSRASPYVFNIILFSHTIYSGGPILLFIYFFLFVRLFFLIHYLPCIYVPPLHFDFQNNKYCLQNVGVARIRQREADPPKPNKTKYQKYRNIYVKPSPKSVLRGVGGGCSRENRKVNFFDRKEKLPWGTTPLALPRNNIIIKHF